MTHNPIHISRDDHTKLRLLLGAAHSSNADINAARQKLREELDRATILDLAAIPADVVSMGSTVEFEDAATGEIEAYTIVFPERADLERNRISILAPIGTALIGSRVGDLVQWPTPGGVRQLKVRQVTPAPAPDVSVVPVPALVAGILRS